MGVRTKTLITVVLVGVVVSVLSLTTQNRQLFKGQIFSEKNNEATETPEQEKELPDLKGTLEIIVPENEEGDLTAQATVENIGKGSVVGGTPFVYSLWINDIEVFSNSDSYSELAPGDAFSFEYPISKTIYQYPSEGEVKFIVDSENTIKESNEGNNEEKKEYKL